MNVHLYFPHYCSVWVKLDTGDMNIMLLSIWEFWENGCIEGPTFLTSINDVKFIHILSPLSTSPPYPHISHLHVCRLAEITFHNYSYNCNGNYKCGQVTITVCSKTPHYFCYFCHRNDHSGSITGQDLEFWMISAVKWCCKQQCIVWNYHLFIGVFFRTRSSEQYLQENDVQEQWIDILLDVAIMHSFVELKF